MGKDVIVACDFSSAEATFAFLDKFANCERKPFLKIGMELYYAEGPSIVRDLPEVMAKYRINSLEEIIGGVK